MSSFPASSVPDQQPQPHPFGHLHAGEQVSVFFGDRTSSKEALASAFPEFRWINPKQIHSDVVIASPFGDTQPEADAHFTRDRGLALIIRTADCVPVMIHEPVSGLIAAIHAGWRGIENEIILKTCDCLAAEGARLSSARAWIGPHIGARSFEVGLDVAAKLEARFQAVRVDSDKATSSLLPHENDAKARVDLLAIALAQLGSRGIPPGSTSALAIDTHISDRHESFRRDRESAGRQISFIALR